MAQSADFNKFNPDTGLYEPLYPSAISDGTNTITPNEIGILSGLNTTEKGSLVGAVNEVRIHVGTTPPTNSEIFWLDTSVE